MPDSRRRLLLSLRGCYPVGQSVDSLNAQNFARRFIYGSDIHESTTLSARTTTRNVLFVRSCPVCDFITPSLQLGSDLGILRACRCISKASAAAGDLCRAVFPGGLGVRRWCTLPR